MTQKHKDMLRDYGKIPFFWKVIHEGTYVTGFMNWLTLEVLVLQK